MRLSLGIEDLPECAGAGPAAGPGSGKILCDGRGGGPRGWWLLRSPECSGGAARTLANQPSLTTLAVTARRVGVAPGAPHAEVARG